MTIQTKIVIDEVMKLIASQAESYRKQIDEQTRAVDEYARLAKSDELMGALTIVVEYGSGKSQQEIDRQDLIHNINIVMTLLFSNPLTGQIKIPFDFWQTDFGRLINAANRRRLGPIVETLNPSQAAKEMGVSRPTLYRWIEQGKLLPLWEGTHPYIPREGNESEPHFPRLDLLVSRRKLTEE